MSIILALRTRHRFSHSRDRMGVVFGHRTTAHYTDGDGKEYGASIGGDLNVTQVADRIRYLRSCVKRDEMKGLYA